jgi:hypothetical protein
VWSTQQTHHVLLQLLHVLVFVQRALQNSGFAFKCLVGLSETLVGCDSLFVLLLDFTDLPLETLADQNDIVVLLLACVEPVLGFRELNLCLVQLLLHNMLLFFKCFDIHSVFINLHNHFEFVFGLPLGGSGLFVLPAKEALCLIIRV